MIFALLIVCAGAKGQLTSPVPTSVPPPKPYVIVKQDDNSQIWQRERYSTDPNGSIVTNYEKYSEIASGLNFKSANGWQHSKDEIDEAPDGSAEALFGQLQVYFPADILNGEIKAGQPNGSVISSQPSALVYYDGTNVAFIAVLTNSIGEIVENNQIWYKNAFSGIKADLKFTYKKSGLEQDVVLNQRPPSPESLGLNPKTTRLQVWTEFSVSSEPVIHQRVLPEQAGVPLVDEELDFGGLRFVQGKAFLLGGNSASALVSKSWMVLNGRHFLVEEVPLGAISSQLKGLLSYSGKTKNGLQKPMLAAENMLKRNANPGKSTQRVKVVRENPLKQSSFVLDYNSIVGAMTNVTFNADTTYFISGATYLVGTNVFEGGTVLKFTNSSSISIDSSTPPDFASGAYRPVVFTAMDDNSIGDDITGSTGIPTNYYASCALNVENGAVIHDARFCYQGVAIGAGNTLNLTNVQILDCSAAIQIPADSYRSLNMNMANCLLANDMTNIDLTWLYGGGSLNAWETTFSGATASGQSLGDAYEMVGMGSVTSWGFYAVNCIFANQNFAGLLGSHIYADYSGFYPPQYYGSDNFNSTAYPFESVGGGNYYLAEGGAFQGVGTTNLGWDLLSLMGQKTTYAPTIYTNQTFTNPVTFSQQASRDTNAADLGFHYDPIDFAFGGCTMTTNEVFAPGTAVGWFRTTSGWYHAGQGIQMSGNLTVTFDGTVTEPTYWVRLNTVQENDTTAGYGHGGIDNWSGPDIPTVTGVFLKCTAMAGDIFNSYFADDFGSIQCVMNNSEFWGGHLGTYGDYMYFTNCLMHEVPMGLWNGNPQSARTLQNCTFIAGEFQLTRDSYGTTPVIVRDSSFDGTFFATEDYYATNASLSDYDYNAYTNSTDPFSIGGANDRQMTDGFNWQPSWFGNYYLPTNSPLIQSGDIPASQLGLYHFTTQTNQEVNGTNIVDIGYHYVATDKNGNPLDSNKDGIPDYLEDPNGDGQSLTITLVAPTNSAAFVEPATIPMQATVFDWSGIVTNVEFYNGSARLAEFPNAPFDYNWPIVAAGSYTVMAEAIDNRGATAYSVPVSVTVTNLCSY